MPTLAQQHAQQKREEREQALASGNTALAQQLTQQIQNIAARNPEVQTGGAVRNLGAVFPGTPPPGPTAGGPGGFSPGAPEQVWQGGSPQQVVGGTYQGGPAAPAPSAMQAPANLALAQRLAELQQTRAGLQPGQQQRFQGLTERIQNLRQQGQPGGAAPGPAQPALPQPGGFQQGAQPAPGRLQGRIQNLVQRRQDLAPGQQQQFQRLTQRIQDFRGQAQQQRQGPGAPGAQAGPGGPPGVAPAAGPPAGPPPQAVNGALYRDDQGAFWKFDYETGVWNPVDPAQFAAQGVNPDGSVIGGIIDSSYRDPATGAMMMLQRPFPYYFTSDGTVVSPGGITHISGLHPEGGGSAVPGAFQSWVQDPGVLGQVLAELGVPYANTYPGAVDFGNNITPDVIAPELVDIFFAQQPPPLGQMLGAGGGLAWDPNATSIQGLINMAGYGGQGMETPGFGLVGAGGQPGAAFGGGSGGPTEGGIEAGGGVGGGGAAPGGAPGSGVGPGQPGAGLGAAGLPLDPAFEAGRRAIEDQLSAGLAQIGVARQEIAPLVNLITSRIGTNQQAAEQQVNESAAGRGIFNSGARQELLGEVRTNYDRERQDLAFDVQRQLADLAVQEQGIQSAYQNAIAELMLDLANRSASSPDTIPLAASPAYDEFFGEGFRSAALPTAPTASATTTRRVTRPATRRRTKKRPAQRRRRK